MEAAFNFKDSSFLVAAGGGGGDFGRGGVEGEEEGEGGLVCSVFASVDGVFLFDLSLEILLAAGVDFGSASLARFTLPSDETFLSLCRSLLDLVLFFFFLLLFFFLSRDFEVSSVAFLDLCLAFRLRRLLDDSVDEDLERL